MIFNRVASNGALGEIPGWSFVEEAQGNFAKESSSLQRVVELQPQNDRALVRLAVCLLHQSRQSEAVVALRRALAINPKSSQAIYMLSRALSSSDPGESARLRKQFETLSAEDAALARSKVLANEGYGASTEQDWGNAIRLFREALEICGTCEIQETLHKNLGLALCRNGNVQAGSDELRQALALNPHDIDVEKALSVIGQ
jgi:tetratricopeptide (TPR) repeat protein